VKIGIIIPLGEDQETNNCPPYSDIRNWGRTADEVGLDSIWIYDHLLYRFPDQPTRGVWEAFTMWTALAEATAKVELGALVVCTAFRNPAIVAKMAVTLDAISDGRIIIGLGAGWHEPEFDAFGLQFERRVDQFEEAIKIITPLVREGKVDFTGEFYSAPNCEMRPQPQRPIPVLIASKGPRMLSLTAEYADQWNLAWYGQAAPFLEQREKMFAALDEAGRSREGFGITAGVNVNFPDLEDIGELAQNKDKWISGSVEDVAAVLAEYADAGVDHVIANINPLTQETIERFAKVREMVLGRVSV
jgi:alkanesulfonate monooxygenase SsuD/methylene tetrahydromethanopterin reductase-like flavin-dependent oxidoreductase (luciferase family)